MDSRDPVRITRRAALLAAAAGGVAAALPGVGIAAEPTTATGRVYETVDGTRRGIPGVLVSNGREVVATDADGRYTVPVGDETVVFVVKPAGFMTPIEPGTMLPRFSYLHQPEGSPLSLGLTFPGVAPTGPLPASIDFELHRQEEPAAFEVVLFTDPQPESDAEVDFIREDVVEALSGTTARFGITAGDIMFDDLSLYDRLNRIIGTAGIPWYNVGGNHDLNFEAPDRRHSRETFKRIFGAPYHAFAYAGAVFILLDDVKYLGADPNRPKGVAPYVGELDADQLSFVANLLVHVPDDKLIVLVLHIPLKNDLDATPENNLTNRAALFKLLEGRRHTLSLSGHTHTTEHHYFGAAEGWLSPVPHHHHVMTAVSGSWWSGPYDHRGVAVADSRDGTPNGFHILSVDGNSYKTRFVPAKEPNRRQVRLAVESHLHGNGKEVMRDFRPGQLFQPPVQSAAVPATTLVANVFDGGPKTTVTVQIGTAEPTPMTRKRRPDPMVTEVFARNEDVKKPWIKAEPSTHIWVTRLPATLPAGTHRVVVRAVTEYGDIVIGTMALEIV